jgi:CRISPR-associated Cas5-like protein
MKSCPIQLEISGPTAMWTRPDTGSSPVSSVAPTFSAVKGIFEAVLRWKSVNVRPTKVEICAPACVGSFRPETRGCEIENHKLPATLQMLFDQTAIFFQN